MGKWSNAAEQFEAAIKINGRAFSPRLNLAIARCEEKKYTEALMSLNEALAIDNTSAAAHFYAGIASLGTDQLEQAQRELTTALSLGGDKFPLAHFFLGLVHMKNGATAQAKLALTSYLEKEPNGDKAQRARQLLDRLNK
jgi:tetratricopeptide (TPR) repeat protein